MTWGAFLRANLQTREAAVDYDYFIAGGIDVRGGAWGRSRDNIGLGIAYAHGGNQKIERTRVAEGYYRLDLDERTALTADIKYMHDEKRSGKDPRGFIFIIAGLVCLLGAVIIFLARSPQRLKKPIRHPLPDTAVGTAQH